MMAEKRGKSAIGKRGEEIACNYLMENGHTVIDRNWRSGHLEIDIVSLDKDGMHFVEVKSRTAPYQAEPEENVDYAKQKKITSAAQKYLLTKALKESIGDVEVFFDIVTVVFEGGKTEVKYFPQAYVPMYY